MDRSGIPLQAQRLDFLECGFIEKDKEAMAFLTVLLAESLKMPSQQLFPWCLWSSRNFSDKQQINKQVYVAQRSCGSPFLKVLQARVDGSLGSLSWWGAALPTAKVGGWALRPLPTQALLWFSDHLILRARTDVQMCASMHCHPMCHPSSYSPLHGMTSSAGHTGRKDNVCSLPTHACVISVPDFLAFSLCALLSVLRDRGEHCSGTESGCLSVTEEPTEWKVRAELFYFIPCRCRREGRGGWVGGNGVFLLNK